MRGLYIHIPFCASKCPYCAFYSETDRDELAGGYLDALLKEAAACVRKDFDTIYIGGGTPSSIPVYNLEKFIYKLLSEINFQGKEFSIEANPESVSDNFVNFIKNSPLSRVSLGVQSFNDEVLKLLGRIHDAARAEQCVIELMDTGKDVNIDIIYDIVNIEEKVIIKTLEKAVALSPAHISAYSYDPADTGYLPGFNTDNTMFEYVETFLSDHGYLKYETSNFAKAGKECNHNMLYWQGEEYIGLGASSHSMIYDKNGNRIRYSRPSDTASYINDPFQRDFEEILGAEEAAPEDIIFGLRMKKGVNMENIKKRFGKLNKNLLDNINKNILAGMLEWEKPYLRASSKGALVLDSLSRSLLP